MVAINVTVLSVAKLVEAALTSRIQQDFALLMQRAQSGEAEREFCSNNFFNHVAV
jgi:hypothetical protein